MYFLPNTHMRRHCLSGYLPKQVEKIRLQKNIELNSRDVEALGAGRVLPMMHLCELVCERGITCHLKVFKRGPFSDKTGTEKSKGLDLGKELSCI